MVLESAERDVEGTIKTELFERICLAVHTEVEESRPGVFASRISGRSRSRLAKKHKVTAP